LTLFPISIEAERGVRALLSLSTDRISRATRAACLFFFFNACIFRYYLSKPLTSLSCSLNAVFPCIKMREHLCFCYYKCLRTCPQRRVTEKIQNTLSCFDSVSHFHRGRERRTCLALPFNRSYFACSPSSLPLWQLCVVRITHICM
jgi:hypothetical protein